MINHFKDLWEQLTYCYRRQVYRFFQLQISYNSWKTVQKIIANEGTLVSECGRITGRLDC